MVASAFPRLRGEMPVTESLRTKCKKRKGAVGSMMVSTKGRYALRLLVDMAEHRTESFVPLKEVAQRQEISEKYLESIVKALVRGGVLAGLRGKGGGYRLKREPEQITVGEVLRLTDGSLAPVSCQEPGSSPCPRMVECRTLPIWKGLYERVNEYLDGYTIADLIRDGGQGGDYVI